MDDNTGQSSNASDGYQDVSFLEAFRRDKRAVQKHELPVFMRPSVPAPQQTQQPTYIPNQPQIVQQQISNNVGQPPLSNDTYQQAYVAQDNTQSTQPPVQQSAQPVSDNFSPPQTFVQPTAAASPEVMIQPNYNQPAPVSEVSAPSVGPIKASSAAGQEATYRSSLKNNPVEPANTYTPTNTNLPTSSVVLPIQNKSTSSKNTTKASLPSIVFGVIGMCCAVTGLVGYWQPWLGLVLAIIGLVLSRAFSSALGLFSKISLFVGILAIIISGVGLYSSYTNQQFTKYVSEGNTFSIQHPRDWTISHSQNSSSKIVRFSSKQTSKSSPSASIAVAEINNLRGKTSEEAFYAMYKKVLSSPYQKFEKSSEQKIKVNDLPALLITSNTTINARSDKSMFYLVYNESGNLYLITFNSEQDLSAKYGKIFKQVIDSFEAEKNLESK